MADRVKVSEHFFCGRLNPGCQEPQKGRWSEIPATKSNVPSWPVYLNHV